MNTEDQNRGAEEIWSDIGLYLAGPASDSVDLLKLLARGLAAYGIANEGSHTDLIGALYERAIESTEVEKRHELLGTISHLVESGRLSVMALFPFAFIETDSNIVSNAVIDIAMEDYPVQGDPIASTKEIINWLVTAPVENKGAVFGGLVSLGDS